ncbi:unnamed protein product [Zymoseptoria tritici ST99CH_1A5]|uniref:Uncharacterized protein n=1 Tax=Zymoseptoria tritici ST99CH_1A5 TaxID=1276529 RepID=A0A1Y6L9G7_ZYMTR|nr:unnamed protein product [Zymoseptoria tritici ST99CH_1A5]
MVHDTRLEPSSVQLLTAQAEPQRKKRCTNAAISSISHSEPSAAHASTKAHSGSSQTTRDSFGEHSSGDEVPDDQLIQNTADDQTSPKLKPFRFLDLAAELRDEVYESVAVDHPYFVPKCGDFKATSALFAVNRQVRDEFLSILENASDIRATVARYNFQHIVRSMNRLPEQHAKKLSASVGTSKKRNIVIALELPYATGDEKSQSTYTGGVVPNLHVETTC